MKAGEITNTFSVESIPITGESNLIQRFFCRSILRSSPILRLRRLEAKGYLAQENSNLLPIRFLYIGEKW